MNSVRTEFSTVKFRHNNEEFFCTFSAGICQSNQVTSIDELVEQADMAMYRAKQRGRNQIVQSDDTH